MKDNRLNLYYTISEVAGLLTAAIGLFVLVGWALDISFMKSVLPGLVTMKGNTALCFLLTGLSLWSLQIKRIDKRPFRVFGNLCAAVVMLVGAITLYQYMSGTNLGIDQLLFVELPGAAFTKHLGRMAFITAVNFVLIGLALLSLNAMTRRRYYPFQVLAAIAIFIALSALCGYLYGLSTFYGKIAIYTATALHATIAFLILCTGVIFVRPDKGLAGVITSTLSRGIMIRRLLLLMFALPIISGWLKLHGERAGFYDSQFGTALMVIANIILFTLFILWTAKALNASDKKKIAAQTGVNTAAERWRRTFDSMMDPTFIMGMDNTILNANQALASILGKSREEIIGKKCFEVMHGLSAPFANCPMEGTRCDGKSHVEEVNDPHIGIPLLVTTSPVFDKDHKMVSVVHVAKDISEIKKAELALRESEIKYRAIFESSADAIMLLIPRGKFLSGNAATIKLFGCKDEKDLLSKSPADLSPEFQPDGQSSSAKSEEMMRRAVERGTNSFEWTHRRPNGEEFFATVLLTRMALNDQVILQATVRDITEQVLSEKQLAKKLRDLEIFYRAAIDREMRIKELKKKVKELEEKIKG